MHTNGVLIDRKSYENKIRSHLASSTQRKLRCNQVERVEIDFTIIYVQNSYLFAWLHTGSVTSRLKWGVFDSNNSRSLKT